MSGTVALPVWFVLLVALLAAAGLLDRILMPSARWVLRRRMERAVARLNARLDLPIRPFKLMRRADTIVRLIYDPKVAEAIVAHARETGVPENVAFAEARRYAREIVPSFSAAAYFGFATRAARWLSRRLYRVRLGHYDEAAIAAIDREATVVFVMNHSSNMDYVLVTWLAAERSALSYAVGEWARVWPLSHLIRAMGAYFIRRRSRNTLYRRVLACYVQMATEEGVTQAIFPEGGLSLDGRVGEARLGLLSYILAGFRPDAARDVVFIPVGIAYDRVLEDRVLLAAAVAGERRFRARLPEIARFVGRTLWQMARGRFRRFGYAAVSFGAPVSLRAFLAAGPEEPAEALGAALMARIRAVVPVLPVPLAAACLSDSPQPAEALEARAAALLEALAATGAHVHLRRESLPETLRYGLDMLVLRGLARNGAAGWQIAPGEAAAVAFYAASAGQHIDAGAASPSQGGPENPATVQAQRT